MAVQAGLYQTWWDKPDDRFSDDTAQVVTEPENWIFAYAKIKVQISCAVTAQISAFVFATQIEQSLLYL